jgi:hypothetical protein
MVPLATIPRQAVIFIFSLTGNFCNALLDRVSEDKPLSGNLSGEPKADLGGLSVNGRKFRDAAFAIHRTSIDYYFPLIAYYGTQFRQQSPLPDPHRKRICQAPPFKRRDPANAANPFGLARERAEGCTIVLNCKFRK